MINRYIVLLVGVLLGVALSVSTSFFTTEDINHMSLLIGLVGVLVGVIGAIIGGWAYFSGSKQLSEEAGRLRKLDGHILHVLEQSPNVSVVRDANGEVTGVAMTYNANITITTETSTNPEGTVTPTPSPD